MIFFRGGGTGGGGGRSGLGGDFRGLLAYLYEGDRAGDRAEAPAPGAESDRVDWVASRNLPEGVNVADWREVNRHISDLKGRTEQPVYHVGIALEPGSHLERDQWEKVVDRVIERLGLQDHRLLVVAHKDSAHQHVHLVVNRVSPMDGRVWKPSFDGIKSASALRELERELGVRELGIEARPQLRLTSGELAVAKASERVPLAATARVEVLQDFREAGSWGELRGRLAAKGYVLEVAERGGGVVLRSEEGLRVSISRIDGDLSGPKLARRFGSTFREHLEMEPAAPTVAAPRGRAAEANEARISRMADDLGARHATWTRGDAMRELAGQRGRGELVEALLASPHVVRLPSPAPGRVERFASLTYLAQETTLLEAGVRLAGAREHAVSPAAVEVARAKHPHLSGEQRDALAHATHASGLALVVGRAGAGKTTLAAAIAEAYRGSGYEVAGLALAAKAARGLEESAGIQSSTIASYTARLDAGTARIGARTLLVVDEAGILDTAQLSGLLDRAAAAGAKVVLMGDPEQLQPIGAGAPYRGLLQDHPHAVLEEIRRQRDPAQADVVRGLARAQVGEALRSHADEGRLAWHGTAEGARAAMVQRWIEAKPEERPLLVAYRRADVGELNAGVQAARSAAGELGTRAGVGELRTGDQVVFRRNGMVEGSAPVQNGLVGRLEGVAGPHLRVSVPGRDELRVDPRQYPHLELGYALGLHQSQGQTAERVEVLADGLMDRHALYVALSRHREAVHLHVPIGLAASSQADRRLLEHAAADNRLRLAVGEGRDVRALNAGDRAALGRDLVTLDQVSLREALAARMSLGRTKDLARDHRGELDLAALVAAREASTRAAGQAAAQRDEALIRQARAAHLTSDIASLRQDLKGRGAELVAAAARAYASPKAALERLEREHSGQAISPERARELATLRGADRAIIGPDAERREALVAVRDVAGAHGRFLEVRNRLHLAQTSLAAHGQSAPGGLPHVAGGRSALHVAGAVLRADSPEQAFVAGAGSALRSAAMQATGAVNPGISKAWNLASSVANANSPESAFVAATSNLGRVALTTALATLPPVLRLPATLGLRLSRKVLDAGIER